MKTPTITKHKLAQALFTKGSGGAIQINDVSFTTLCSIEREDGSGSSFNVKGYAIDADGWIELKTIHVVTID
jgi:hypothetical protein